MHMIIKKEDNGISLAELVEKTGPYPYKILLARVNGKDTELTETVSEKDEVEFFDMRTHSANLVYQRMLSIIYLTAVKKVYEKKGVYGVTAEIQNSLNKGFFTTIKGVDIVSKKTVSEIEACMKEIVEKDVPVIKETVTKEKAIKICNSYGYHEQAELIASSPETNFKMAFYRLDLEDEDNKEAQRYNFFGPMAPSAGYADKFELRKYHDAVLLRFPHYKDPDVIPEYSDEVKLYETFEEEHQWLELLQTKYLHEINGAIADGKTRDMILLSEALHEKKIAEIADTIKKKGKRIILIAGPSSSGKTTFSHRLSTQLRVNGLSPICLGTDDFFVDRKDIPFDENGEQHFEDLDALDIKLFNKNMNELLAGKEADLPEFDFIDGVKYFGRRITKIDANQPIIIEGIHALNGELTKQIKDEEKFKIYISPLIQLNIDPANRIPTTDGRMMRRMVRDNKYRGHSASVTIMSWPKVRAGEDKNIYPFSKEADVVFNSTLVYETCLLKKHVVPLLEAIPEEDPAYSEAQRLLSLLKFFYVIDGDDIVPNNSILKEFIGGSVFVE